MEKYEKVATYWGKKKLEVTFLRQGVHLGHQNEAGFQKSSSVLSDL